jgi:hypothetical protein
MSDFPRGGDIEATRAWLDKEGFQELFVGWEADALLGLEERHILSLGGENGLMLWGLLNTARITTGTFYRLKFIPSSLYSISFPLIYFPRLLSASAQLGELI